VGNIFLPQIEEERDRCQDAISKIIKEEGQHLLGWREVPMNADAADVGPAARMAQPFITQLFIAAANSLAHDEFERVIYIIRKRFTHMLRNDESLTERKQVYACSLSTKVIVYKGMLTPGQLLSYGAFTF